VTGGPWANRKKEQEITAATVLGVGRRAHGAFSSSRFGAVMILTSVSMVWVPPFGVGVRPSVFACYLKQQPKV
jgi:hypothetical protein